MARLAQEVRLNQPKSASHRSEDMAHWIFRPKEPGEPSQPVQRLTFSTEFSKCRNCTLHHAADASG